MQGRFVTDTQEEGLKLRGYLSGMITPCEQPGFMEFQKHHRIPQATLGNIVTRLPYAHGLLLEIAVEGSGDTLFRDSLQPSLPESRGLPRGMSHLSHLDIRLSKHPAV